MGMAVSQQISASSVHTYILYIYMCVCVYIYMYVCMYIYIHICTCAHAHKTHHLRAERLVNGLIRDPSCAPWAWWAKPQVPQLLLRN
jgi:hypothetical protein